jgi:predicted nucleotidyltransferase
MSEREFSASVRLALEEFKKVLGDLYGDRLRGVYLYGSYARGAADQDSDVDVVAILTGEVNPYREIDLFSEALSDICLRHAVLIAAYPVPEVWLRERKSPLFENIRREGILL